MKYNVILIVMDVQRASNIHCYGYEKNTTPNIDKIAREGTIFLKCISPGVWTLPSHASIFTGRYVCGHGVGARYNFKPVEKYTLAEIFKARHYRTVGFCNRGHWWARYGIRDDRGFDEFYTYTFSSLTEWVNVGSSREIQDAIKWIKANKSKPFFMFINCLEPHLPYIPPPKYVKRFAGEIDFETVEKVQPNVWKVRMGIEKIDEKRWKILRKLYDGETACLDERLGRLFTFLEEENLIDKTILILTSDHGDEQGEHYPPHIAHQLHLYQPGIHVPLIIRNPELFPMGEEIDSLVQTHDIFPTLLEVLNVKSIEVWKQNQAHSLFNTLKGEEREYALSEYQEPLLVFERFLKINPKYDFRKWYKSIKALIVDEYKYIWYSNGEEELYNLRKDPLERENIVESEDKLTEKMREKLYNILFSLDQRDLGDLVQGSEDNIRKLKKLGYIRETNTVVGRIMKGMTP
ncbi:MAG TPA: hypothetical protein ENF87_00510 [Thermoproteales archaeon]|nr:hypothetical protein [Thermoproteales archaeon]